MDRRSFDEKVFDRLKEAIREAGVEVPELEAVAVVCLWRFPDQSSLPSKLLVGTDGPVVNPDQHLRLASLGIELSRFLLQQGVEGTQAIHAMASDMARIIYEQAASQGRQEKEQAAPADAGAAADGP